MLKLKLQYFGHLKRRVDSLEKTLMLGGIGLVILLAVFQSGDFVVELFGLLLVFL